MGRDLTTDPRAYFDSLSQAEQDRLFTIDGARAIRDGADMSQVVNARRGMHTAGGRRLTGESTTRFGVTRPGRLMPEEIYRQAGSRGEVIDLLRQHGYLRAVPPPRVSVLPVVASRAAPGLPSAQRLVAATGAELESAAKLVYENTFAGIRTTVTQAHHLDDRTVAVRGELRDSSGASVGEFSRLVMRVDDGATVAYHDALELAPRVQGQGFAQAFNGHLERWYRVSGLDRIELYANIDVGGYAWARSGYNFAHQRAAERVFHRLRGRIDFGQLDELGTLIPPADVAAARELLDRAERLPFGSARYPTAYEVSQLGRVAGAGRDDMWLGKRTLLGSNWDAVKPL